MKSPEGSPRTGEMAWDAGLCLASLQGGYNGFNWSGRKQMTNTIYVMGTGLWLMALMMVADGNFMDTAAAAILSLTGF